MALITDKFYNTISIDDLTLSLKTAGVKKALKTNNISDKKLAVNNTSFFLQEIGE